MSKDALRTAIVHHALPLATFDGWNMATLRSAAAAAGYAKTDAIRAFPGGAAEAADFYLALADQYMLAALEGYHLDSMKIRERIALAVRLWISGQEQHREALRRAFAVLAVPLSGHSSTSCLWRTSGAIWQAIGDRSTDFSYYTKRLILSGVLSSTLLFWLDDQSAGRSATWAFLDRRIENVMQFEKAKGRLKGLLAQSPFRRAA